MIDNNISCNDVKKSAVPLSSAVPVSQEQEQVSTVSNEGTPVWNQDFLYQAQRRSRS